MESLAFPPEAVNFESVMADIEKRYLKVALEKADGVCTRAADLLKISYGPSGTTPKNTIYEWVSAFERPIWPAGF